jgi:hypothetical protein
VGAGARPKVGDGLGAAPGSLVAAPGTAGTGSVRLTPFPQRAPARGLRLRVPRRELLVTSSIITRPAPARRQIRKALAPVAVVAAGALLLLALTVGLRGPKFVDRVTISNPGGFDVNVDVTDGDRDGRLGLAQVPAGEQVKVREVIDQGVTWVFTFSYGGTDAGEFALDRKTLERDGWRVDVPAEVHRRLAAAGHDPSSG